MTRTELDVYLSGGFDAYLTLLLGTEYASDPAALSAWLDSAVADALRRVGYPAASFTSPDDSDLSAVPAASSSAFLAVARYEVADRLSLAFGTYVDMQHGIDKQSLHQLSAALDKILARLSARMEDEFPELSFGGLSAGRIRLSSTSRNARVGTGSELG